MPVQVHLAFGFWVLGQGGQHKVRTGVGEALQLAANSVEERVGDEKEGMNYLIIFSVQGCKFPSPQPNIFDQLHYKYLPSTLVRYMYCGIRHK